MNPATLNVVGGGGGTVTIDANSLAGANITPGTAMVTVPAQAAIPVAGTTASLNGGALVGLVAAATTINIPTITVTGSSRGNFTLVRNLRDHGNVTFAGIIGAKWGSVLPYLKVGMGLHSFKWSETYTATQTYRNLATGRPTTYSYPYTQKKKAMKVLLAVGAGFDWNLTQNILLGAEWVHRRGNLGIYKSSPTGRQYYSASNTIQDFGKIAESNKVYMNEVMVTLKYALPVN